PKYFDLNATCQSYMRIYKADNINELIQLMLLDKEECFVFQKFPNDSRPLECYYSSF
ncbi:hypothetical protein BgiBS90_037202, partial [Biomphalaria glabrata]